MCGRVGRSFLSVEKTKKRLIFFVGKLHVVRFVINFAVMCLSHAFEGHVWLSVFEGHVEFWVLSASVFEPGDGWRPGGFEVDSEDTFFLIEIEA